MMTREFFFDGFKDGFFRSVVSFRHKIIYSFFAVYLQILAFEKVLQHLGSSLNSIDQGCFQHPAKIRTHAAPIRDFFDTENWLLKSLLHRTKRSTLHPSKL
jgi:hypothetical protein